MILRFQEATIKRIRFKMKFAEKLRELRQAKNFSQRALASKVGVDFTYLSKIENEKLDFAQYPSEDLILKLAVALDADADELLLLAEKIPPGIKKRVMERPDVFRQLASLDDNALDVVMQGLGGSPESPTRKRQK